MLQWEEPYCTAANDAAGQLLKGSHCTPSNIGPQQVTTSLRCCQRRVAADTRRPFDARFSHAPGLTFSNARTLTTRARRLLVEVVADVGRLAMARFSDDTFQELSHYIDFGDALGMLARGLPEPDANRGAEGEANVMSVSVTRSRV